VRARDLRWILLIGCPRKLRGTIQVEMRSPIPRVITGVKRMGHRMVAARFFIRERPRANEAANSGEELQWRVEERQLLAMRTQ
jgi:hypothetical protein